MSRRGLVFATNQPAIVGASRLRGTGALILFDAKVGESNGVLRSPKNIQT